LGETLSRCAIDGPDSQTSLLEGVGATWPLVGSDFSARPGSLWAAKTLIRPYRASDNTDPRHLTRTVRGSSQYETWL